MLLDVSAVWATRDESGNYSQKHDAEIIKEEKRIEVENEVRLQVDELMREELKNLKMVRPTVDVLKLTNQTEILLKLN